MKLPKVKLSVKERKGIKESFENNTCDWSIKSLRDHLKDLMSCIEYDKYVISLVVKTIKDLEKSVKKVKKVKKKR